HVAGSLYLDSPSGPSVVWQQAYVTPAVVPLALLRVGDELFLVRRGDVPEQLGHPPRPVAVEHQQPVALPGERLRRALQGLGRRALQKGARLGIDRTADEIVRGGIPHVEMHAGLELHQLDEVGLTKRPALARRMRGA